MSIQVQEHTATPHEQVSEPALQQRPPTPLVVLEELFLLLEDYAPAWYTEEHHDRAVAALSGRAAPRP